MVKEQIHFKNETGLDIYRNDIIYYLKKNCKGCQKFFEDSKIKETAIVSVGVQVGVHDKEFQPTNP